MKHIKKKIFMTIVLVTCMTLTACSGKSDLPAIETRKGSSEAKTVTKASSADSSTGASVEEPEEEKKISRIDYYGSDGVRRYFEIFVYYDDGLLCSKTLYSDNHEEYGDYTSPGYTFLYLYDENGNLQETNLGSLGMTTFNAAPGKVFLGYQQDESGDYQEIAIFPEDETIEQEKFGVDPSKTEVIYDTPYILSTDQSSEKWASAYLRDVFRGNEATDMTSCQLLYIDDNDVPELWVDYFYGYAGAEAVTVKNNVTDRFYVSHGYIRWKERENKVLAGSGHMDVYSTYVYRIVDGKFEAIAGGPWGASDNANLQFDEEGYPVYEYHLGDEQVSEEEFNNAIEAAFDEDDASDTDTGAYTFEQCKRLLEYIEWLDDPMGSETNEVQNADQLISNLKDEYGVASNREFETMRGGEWIPFPDDVYGFVNAVELDLDGDKKDEIVALRSQKDRGFFIDVYKLTETGYALSCSEWISVFEGASAKTIAVFFAMEIDGYGIVVDRESSGTYTRETSIGADVYQLTADSVELINKIEWNSVIGQPGEEGAVGEEMYAMGIPYAENAASYGNFGNDSYWMLCRVVHRVEDAVSYEDLRGYLKIEY